MAKTINAFPLTVLHDQLGLDPQYQEALVRKILAQRQRDPSKPAGEAWTGEGRDRASLQTLPDFDLLFDRLAVAVAGYLATLGVSRDKFSLFFAKSWGGVAERGERLSNRSYPEGHIGFSCFLKMPLRGATLNFYQRNPQNEFLSSIFTQRMIKAGVLQKVLPVNTGAVTMDTAEGDVAIYAGKTEYGTQANAVDAPWISVSGFLILTLKDSTEIEWGTPDPKNWKEF